MTTLPQRWSVSWVSLSGLLQGKFALQYDIFWTGMDITRDSLSHNRVMIRMHRNIADEKKMVELRSFQVRACFL